MFGKYRIVSSLGHGSSSDVYLAEHTKLKVYRALKRIRRTKHTQPQFLLETDILKNLKHPGIPTIYDVEEDEEAYYIIEEYIQGQSLEAFVLHQDCISTDTVIRIVLQICEVLDYLHNQKPYPIIYQDLKPEHIILCGERVVLVDFGIASYITSSGSTFQNFGTRGYAAPEKYNGIACDERTDVYGIGKILTFLAQKLQKDQFHFLEPLIGRASALSMDGRYASVRELSKDLTGLLHDGDQNIYPKQKEHLLTNIAVAGTQERVGVTHIAVSMTCYFNQNKRPCIYQERHESDCMRLLVREAGSYYRDGLIVRERFWGVPYYGETVEKQGRENCMYIQDYGVQWQDILEDEDRRLVIVTGSRPWEAEKTRELLAQVSCRSNLVLICNYNDHVQTKELAKMYHHRVYCFPLDSSPFRMTREKRRFFQRLLLQEGW